MTKDEADRIAVRIELAMTYLAVARDLPVSLEDENDAIVSDMIEEALQSLQTAFALCKNFSGA